MLLDCTFSCLTASPLSFMFAMVLADRLTAPLPRKVFEDPLPSILFVKTYFLKPGLAHNSGQVLTAQVL